MPQLKIAVMLGNLRLEPYEGMKKVVEMGVTGLHLSAGGDWDSRTMSPQARKDLVAHIKGLGLEVSALSVWGGEVDLGEEEGWEENVAWGYKNLEMAADLECGIWQGHCGIMPESPEHPHWQRFLDGMGRLSAHGEKVGACLAIETGPEPPFVLRRLLTEVGSKALRINWDPANMILWPAAYCRRANEVYRREKWIEKFQPTEGANALVDAIVHTHAKDALVTEEGAGKEVPLGTGWVDWPRYVGYLRQGGYDGYFAIERETGADPVGDIQRAVDFLKSL